jgi:hypothetical protein
MRPRTLNGGLALSLALLAAPAWAEAPEPAQHPPAPAEAPAPGPSGRAAAPPARPGDSEPAGSLSGGLRAQLLVPAALTGRGAADATNVATADRTASFGLLADLRVRLPGLGGRLAVVAEAGWYRLTATGERGAETDPDFGRYRFDWTIDALPVTLGLAVDLFALGPVRFTAAAGADLVTTWSEGAWTVSATGCEADCRVADPVRQTTTFGWHVDLEASLPLGPGRLVGGYRYADARTRFMLPEGYATVYSPAPAMLLGSSVLLGYRF